MILGVDTSKQKFIALGDFKNDPYVVPNSCVIDII